MARVSEFLNNIIKGGLSYNNEYTFTFSSNGTEESINGIVNELKGKGFSKAFSQIESTGEYLFVGPDSGDKLRVLCEEISLPGVSSATGPGRSIVQGQDFKYSHTKVYNDLNISFICDKTLTPLRFFQAWYDFIYVGGNDLEQTISGQNNPKLANDVTYTTKLYYEYCLDMYIAKIETKYSNKSSSTPGFQNAFYALKNVHPISISAIPLNSGASSVTRVSVTLAYERWSYRTAPGLIRDNESIVWTS